MKEIDLDSSGKNERLDSAEKVIACAVTHDYNRDYFPATWYENPDHYWTWRECCRNSIEGFDITRRVPQWLSRLAEAIRYSSRDKLKAFYVYLTADATKIGYTPTPEYGRQDRQVVTTLGRFLTKHFKDELSESDIRDWTDIHRQMYLDNEVRFAFGADDIEHVYVSGPESCMSHAHLGESYEHPVRIYDGPDTALAFLQTKERITARALVRLDNEPMTYGRLYGDQALLKARLEGLGFTQEPGLDAARLRLVRDENHRIRCPYIDNSEYAQEENGFLVVSDDEGRDCQITNGWLGGGNEDEDENTRYCEHCEQDVDYDHDSGGYDRHENWICSGCLDDGFYYAYVGRREQAYVHIDDTVEVGGEYYLHDSDVLGAHNIVECADGECRDMDDCVYIESSGDYVHCDDAVQPFGCEDYYDKDDCTKIDGVWVRDEDVEEYEAQQKLDLEETA